MQGAELVEAKQDRGSGRGFDDVADRTLAEESDGDDGHPTCNDAGLAH